MGEAGAAAPTAHELYGQALEAVSRGRPVDALRLRDPDGAEHLLPLGQWLRAPDADEEVLLGQACGPVLDVGCGPGRHVLALTRRGTPALGLDVAPEAVRIARRRGARVLQRSVFAAVPLTGCWGTALLLDGNVGIGGDPVALLGRLRVLLRPTGRVLVELEAPGTPSARLQAHLESAGRVSRPFAWALVSQADIELVAATAGLEVHAVWRSARGRWFARLDARLEA